MPSMNVSLTDELLALIQDKVASGMYNNASEVIREALRHLDANEELLHQLKLTQLKQALRPGIEQAENDEYAEYSYEKLMTEIDNETTQ